MVPALNSFYEIIFLERLQQNSVPFGKPLKVGKVGRESWHSLITRINFIASFFRLLKFLHKALTLKLTK